MAACLRSKSLPNQICQCWLVGQTNRRSFCSVFQFIRRDSFLMPPSFRYSKKFLSLRNRADEWRKVSYSNFALQRRNQSHSPSCEHRTPFKRLNTLPRVTLPQIVNSSAHRQFVFRKSSTRNVKCFDKCHPCQRDDDKCRRERERTMNHNS